MLKWVPEKASQSPCNITLIGSAVKLQNLWSYESKKFLRSLHFVRRIYILIFRMPWNFI